MGHIISRVRHEILEEERRVSSAVHARCDFDVNRLSDSLSSQAYGGLLQSLVCRAQLGIAGSVTEFFSTASGAWCVERARPWRRARRPSDARTYLDCPELDNVLSTFTQLEDVLTWMANHPNLELAKQLEAVVIDFCEYLPSHSDSRA